MILVAHGDAQVRAFLASAIEASGAHALQAASAEEAAYIWAREGESIRLLLVEKNLPGMPGANLARELRELNPDLEARILCGPDDKAVAPADAEAPSIKYARMPMSKRAVIEIVSAMVGKSMRAIWL